MAAEVLDRPAVPAHRPLRRRRRTLLIGLLTLLLLVVVAVVSVGSLGDGAGPPGTIGRLDPATLATTDAEFIRTGDGLLLVGRELGTAAADGEATVTVARYAEGGWWAYPTPPAGCCLEVALGADGVVYGNHRGDVLELVDGAWAPLPERGNPPGDAWRIATDPGSGVLWASTGERLYRWDGEAWTAAPQLEPVAGQPDGGHVGDIEVTPDGAVWATGMDGWIPELGGLARYDPVTASWERVRPWAAHGDVPAEAMTVGPEGDLWVLLADWSPDWGERQQVGEPGVRAALAHLDPDTGGWDVRELDARTHPSALAAATDGVWLAHGRMSIAVLDDFPGVAHLVGDRWEQHLEDRVVSSVGIDDDGGLWVSLGGHIERLDLDG
jgi:hypothetical protein